MGTLRDPTADPSARRGAGPVRIAVRGHLSGADAELALRLADRAARADGVLPLSEDARLHLRDGGGAAALNLFLHRGGELAGFAHLDPPDPEGERSGELFIDPGQRRHGLGRLLAGAALAESGGSPVRIWAHGDLPAAAALAASAGFCRVRALWQMSRPLDDDLAEPHLPPGVSVRTFVPGRDEAAWLALNARAFGGHPEQGRWTSKDLALREGEPWFDPAGFFLAERDGQAAGFHWTKIHPAAAGPVGEVYVIGTDPAARGTGLGAALTLVGLRYLRSRGAGRVMLYVDEDNAAAIGLYRSLGFSKVAADVMYRHV